MKLGHLNYGQSNFENKVLYKIFVPKLVMLTGNLDNYSMKNLADESRGPSALWESVNKFRIFPVSDQIWLD